LCGRRRGLGSVIIAAAAVSDAERLLVSHVMPSRRAAKA
jgi:hypothetical protein